MPAHDLSKLTKWLAQEDWSPLFEEVMDEHFGPAMEAFDLEFEEIDEVLGGGWGMTLWGCAFEDVLTRSLDGRSPVDAYLQRRGWTESTGAKRYMTALQTSVMSLYEISDLTPGQSLRARDLIRGGEPVLVSERTATKTLKAWDRIACRIVPQGDGLIIAGGVLAFTLEGSELLMTALQDAITGPADPRRRPKADPPAARTLFRWTGTDEQLQQTAPLFTTSWLFDVLPRALGLDEQTIQNSEGDEIVFHELTFRLAPKASSTLIQRRLQQLETLRGENDAYWNWIGAPAPTPAGTDKGLSWNVTLEDGSVVLGAIELKGRTLVLNVNSNARADRGQAMLEEALGGLLQAPLTKVQTIEQLRAERGEDPPPGDPEIPPEVQTELVHATLDKQYRAIIDQPVPALGDVSPRAAARSAKGREKIAGWLKHLENRSSHAGDRSDPMATYDFTWLWRELEVEHLRK